MTGITVNPVCAAPFRPDWTNHLPRQLFPELLRFATDLIQFSDEDVHAGEVRPFHPDAKCKLRSFCQSAPIRPQRAYRRYRQFSYTTLDVPCWVPSWVEDDTLSIKRA